MKERPSLNEIRLKLTNWFLSLVTLYVNTFKITVLKNKLNQGEIWGYKKLGAECRGGAKLRLLIEVKNRYPMEYMFLLL